MSLIILVIASVLLLWASSASPPTLELVLTDTLGLYARNEVQWPEGTLTVRAGLAWGENGASPEVLVSYTPWTPMVTISWSCDSLACILVQPGQEITEGQLIGYISAKEQARAAALAERLPQIQDELVAAEVHAELGKITQENEIRALVPGRVLRVEVEQLGRTLKVRVLVLCKIQRTL